MSEPSLWSLFLAQLPPEAAASAPAGGAVLLDQKLREAREAWPEVRVADEVFVRYLAARVPARSGLDAWLGQVHAADLLLACGCAMGDVGALARFDRAVLEEIAPAVARIDASPGFLDEVIQQLRRKLLVAEGDVPGRITEFAGHGPLRSWARAAALRTALNLRRTQGRQELPVGDDALLELPAHARDPELDLLRSRFREDFVAALELAVRSLSSTERNLLRLHFVDGLSLSQIGAAYQADKSTISRRIAKARAQVLAEVQAELQRKLGIAAGELDSLVRLVDGDLDLSINSLLRRSQG